MLCVSTYLGMHTCVHKVLIWNSTDKFLCCHVFSCYQNQTTAGAILVWHLVPNFLTDYGCFLEKKPKCYNKVIEIQFEVLFGKAHRYAYVHIFVLWIQWRTKYENCTLIMKILLHRNVFNWFRFTMRNIGPVIALKMTLLKYLLSFCERSQRCKKINGS